MNGPDPGATPLDPDEARALIPRHIATRPQLNELELNNIVEGERWAFARRRNEVLQDVAAQVDGHSYPIRAAALLDAC
jgi:hypothetical protein